MFDRIALGIAAILLTSACASPGTTASNASDKTAETIADGSGWQPYPGASKDEEFLERTPSEFRPFVEACDPWDDWEKPAPPFKVYGNTYYVGTCGIAAILITGEKGHILIDSGTEAGADIVLSNIRTLGINPQDIELLLHSHEHFDHVGGMFKIMQATGGKVIASKPAAAVFFSGQDHPRDPQFGMHEPMASFVPERHIEDGESEELGNLRITAIETPGHTPGALSWHWQSCEDELCLTIGYADSLSPISRDGYKFSEHPRLLAAHEKGLESLARVDCQILLTPHPSSSRMIKRMRTDALVEQSPCAYYAIDRIRAMEARLEREAGGDQ